MGYIYPIGPLRKPYLWPQEWLTTYPFNIIGTQEQSWAVFKYIVFIYCI